MNEREALDAINMLACFATEEDPTQATAALLAIGEKARAALAQPPREPLTLTDAKLWELWQVRGQGPIDFARAVIAAAQEKP